MIDPNVGMVAVPDGRLEPLRRIAKTTVVIPAAIEFVDIAGLVKGASQGEGLGNKFLTHVREVDAIVQVVRCFEDADVHHVSGHIDPVRDLEIINTELALADLDSVRKRRERVVKDVKRGDKAAAAEEVVLGRIEAVLDQGKPALIADLSADERAIAKTFFLLTEKPTIFACKVKDTDLATADTNPHVLKVRDYVRTHLACEAVVISAQIESDLVDLAPEEAEAFLKESRRPRERHRGAHPRHVCPARPADLLHGRREGGPRVDHPQGRHRAQSRRRHPLRLRAGVHQGRNRGLHRSHSVRIGGGRPREGPVSYGR